MIRTILVPSFKIDAFYMLKGRTASLKRHGVSQTNRLAFTVCTYKEINTYLWKIHPLIFLGKNSNLYKVPMQVKFWDIFRNVLCAFWIYIV